MRARLLRAVAARPRVLLLTAVGGTAVRLAAERELRRRDFPQARTPADADVLFVAGEFAPTAAAAVERLWQDMPAPRVRAGARTAREVPGALTAACASLAVRDQPQERPARPPDRRQPPPATAHGHGDGHGHGDEHGDEQGHGHGHGDAHAAMTPYGLPMAEPAPDRDGLTLDRLHLALGPFLPHWPAGLIVHITLQGDVIQQAHCATSTPAAPQAPAFWSEPWLRAAAGAHVTAGEAARRRAAAHLDSLGRFLAVAGLRPAATAAGRLRDDVLDGSPYEQVRARAERLARRVGRSRSLDWSTGGIGRLSRAELSGARAPEGEGAPNGPSQSGPSQSEPSRGVPPPSGPAARADGDVPARYRQWLREITYDLARMDDRRPLDPYADDTPRGRLDPARPPSRVLVDVLPRLLAGAELAAARLIVASLDPDVDELPVAAGAVAGG